ncbi:hypothetical protein BDQ17DRAFT_1328925 [Cyathus striatus]|nr:hypothetical protein BDQ17DRAFT_1328925 [Cyathus striatus]
MQGMGRTNKSYGESRKISARLMSSNCGAGVSYKISRNVISARISYLFSPVQPSLNLPLATRNQLAVTLRLLGPLPLRHHHLGPPSSNCYTVTENSAMTLSYSHRLLQSFEEPFRACMTNLYERNRKGWAGCRRREERESSPPTTFPSISGTVADLRIRVDFNIMHRSSQQYSRFVWDREGCLLVVQDTISLVDFDIELRRGTQLAGYSRDVGRHDAPSKRSVANIQIRTEEREGARREEGGTVLGVQMEITATEGANDGGSYRNGFVRGRESQEVTLDRKTPTTGLYWALLQLTLEEEPTHRSLACTLVVQGIGVCRLPEAMANVGFVSDGPLCEGGGGGEGGWMYLALALVVALVMGIHILYLRLKCIQ